MNSKALKVSIIIRTYNEERWISHCLEAIFSQDFDNLEVIIVDNKSSDYTVGVAERYPIAAVVNIDKYTPGKAINDGIRASNGDYIVCISAHCIPKDNQWLKKLYNNFKDNKKLAGVYGRQLPVSYTSDADKRDLLITFGRDRKVQKKDYFFHNANSMLPREVWENYPFDEELTNIEDRVWGKRVIEAGYEIIYEPSAPVYHYHGLHQHENSSGRAKGIATILDKLDSENTGKLPESLRPENANFIAVLPVIGKSIEKKGVNFLQRLFDYLKNSKYINNIYVISDNEFVWRLVEKNNALLIKRPDLLKDRNASLEDVLRYALMHVERLKDFPEAIVYIDYLYQFRPKNLIDDLILECQYEGLDTVFSSYIDYGNYWKKSENNAYIKISDSIGSRIEKQPLHRALYGVGCVTLASSIRKGHLIGDKIGILPMKNLLYSLRLDESTPIEVVLAGVESLKNK